MLKLAVFCSWSVERDGLVGVAVCGRAKLVAKGLFDPVGVGFIAIG